MGKFVDACGEDAEIPRTLTEWVRNFRMKKVQMKRKLRGAGNGLRIAAILSTALLHAEQNLRRKQQERFNRWLDIQAKFMPKYCGRPMPHYNHNEMSDKEMDAAAAELKRQRIEEDNLWNGELSGLNDFMRSISSSCNQNQQQSSQPRLNPTTITVNS